MASKIPARRPAPQPAAPKARGPRKPSRICVGLLNTALVGLATLVLILGLELGARLATRLHLLAPTTITQFRLNQPEPYKDAPYFSRAFVLESMRAPGGWQTPPGTHLVIPNDFSGKVISTKNGMRTTTGQPADFTRRVMLFGGSTLFNAEVPDAYTVASQLQALLNEKAPNTFKVENYGASTVNAAQQLERLESLSVNPNDVVVFFDGVNDATQGVYYNNPQGWIVQSNREKLAHLGPVMAYAVRLQLWLRDHSALAAAILPAGDATLPPHLANPQQLAAAVQATTAAYSQALTKAAELTRSQQGTFLHVLQPSLATKPKLSAYEATLPTHTYLIPNGLLQAMQAAWPALQQAHANLQEGGITSVDLSSLQNDTPGEIYLDHCHTNHVGNARIAQTLAALIPVSPTVVTPTKQK